MAISHSADPTMASLDATLAVGGMHCGGCAAALEGALAKLPGVITARVDFARSQAWLQLADANALLAAREAVASLGFTTDSAAAAPVAAPASAGQRHGDALAAETKADDTEAAAGAEGDGATRGVARAELLRVLIAWFAMMQVMMFAYPAWVAEAGTLAPDAEQLLRLASLVVTTPTLWFCGGPILRRAQLDLRRGTLGMDVPVALGLVAAYVGSLIAIVRGSGDVYFDSITMFLAFLLTARWLEAKGRARAVQEIDALASKAPRTARKLLEYPHGEQVEIVQISELAVGDFVSIENGGYVPADGTIVRGQTQMDEAWLTGESQPVAKALAANVLAGSINAGQPVVMRVARTGEATELGLMLKLMQRAALEKPAIATLADRIAGRFVAVVLGLAALAAMGWLSVDASRALPIALAVLVVSCPCALSLALPVALVAAQGTLARRGLLLTRGRALEALAQANHFVFDKTGTLTWGRVRVVDATFVSDDARARTWPLVAALENGVSHPLAKALLAAARDGAGDAERATPVTLTYQVVVDGQGVEGVAQDGQRYRLGSEAFVAECVGTPKPAGLNADGFGSVAYLGCEAGWLAAFMLADDVRADAGQAISALKQAGVRVSLLSGDRPEAVATVATALGIEDHHAALTPQQKHAAVAAMQERGGHVAMVGDGVNDGPVLAQANVSIVMGTGAPLAQRHGDFVLMREGIAAIVTARALAQKASRVIQQNLVWAFAYNIIAIPLALVGLLPPAVAALGMSLSSLMVVANALRLVDRRA